MSDEDDLVGVTAMAPPVLRVGDRVQTDLGYGVLVGALRTSAGLELWVSLGHHFDCYDDAGDHHRSDAEVAVRFERDEVAPWRGGQ